MTLPAMAPHFPELQDAGWLRRKYELEGLSSYAIAAELGCRPTTVSRALHRYGIHARMGRPAVVAPGQVYGRLTVLGELPGRTRAAVSFVACACAGARPPRGRSNCDRERSAPAAACSTSQGGAATAGHRACRAENATEGWSCCTRQSVRAHARPGYSAVAATAAARRPFAGQPHQRPHTAPADACSRSTASAAQLRTQLDKAHDSPRICSQHQRDVIQALRQLDEAEPWRPPSSEGPTRARAAVGRGRRQARTGAIPRARGRSGPGPRAVRARGPRRRRRPVSRD
jgi:hypothetical protein